MSSYPKWVYHKTAGGQIVPDKETHDALPPGWYGTPDEAATADETHPHPPPLATEEAWPTAPDTENGTSETPPRRVHRKK